MLLLSIDSSVKFLLTAIAVVFGLVFIVRRIGSKFFVVDGMSIGGSSGGEDGDVNICAFCRRVGMKRCSACKSTWYCSRQCQEKHWAAGHKFRCKKAGPPNGVDSGSSVDDTSRRRKPSGSGPVCLVPTCGKSNVSVLQEPKRILFPYDEFVELFKCNYPGFPPCGLLNCGNSCFANVVLQCLTWTRPLVAYLLERDHFSRCIRKRNGWCFLCELQNHVQRAFKSREPFSPVNILSRLPNIGGNLGYGSQEDAHEFMRFAIDTMQSVCLDEYGGEKALDHSTQETTLIQHIFGGHLQSQVICTNCNMISNRYENMMDLTVEIHGEAESLEECLDQFTVKEWMDGDNMYKCDGCNDYVKAWKRLTVHQAPNILTITLKRFQSGRFGKLNKRVTFPENLNLAPYMSGNGDERNLYSLYAVVVHLDMLSASFFGHYICYIKNFEGHWYRIDDCKVTYVEVDEVLSQGAYMLLYSRTSPRKEPFTRPTEPVKTKQIPLAATSAGSYGINASHPSNDSSQSNISLRGTGHNRDLEIEFDASKRRERDGNESAKPVDSKDSGDVDMVDSHINLPVGNDLQEGKQFNDFSDADRFNEEVTTVSGYDKNNVYDTDATSSSVGCASTAETEPILPPNGVHEVFDASEAHSPCTDNGFLGKSKPIFSRGFLDRPKQKTLAGHKRTQSELSKTNGHSNGVSELDSDAVSEASCSSQYHEYSSNGAYVEDVASVINAENGDNGVTDYQDKVTSGECEEKHNEPAKMLHGSSNGYVKNENNDVKY